MVAQTDIEAADRLNQRRARMLPTMAVIFIAQQGIYFTTRTEDLTRPVDQLRIAGWLLMSIVLLLALTTGGFWFRPKRVRELMDDELTRANRADALRVGFLATMAGAIGLFFVSFFEPLGPRETIHLLMAIGIAMALIRFGQLERRALRNA
jgi:hypothetical protein